MLIHWHLKKAAQTAAPTQSMVDWINLLSHDVSSYISSQICIGLWYGYRTIINIHFVSWDNFLSHFFAHQHLLHHHHFLQLSYVCDSKLSLSISIYSKSYMSYCYQFRHIYRSKSLTIDRYLPFFILKLISVLSLKFVCAVQLVIYSCLVSVSSKSFQWNYNVTVLDLQHQWT